MYSMDRRAWAVNNGEPALEEREKAVAPPWAWALTPLLPLRASRF
jgi:hypothetical protein